MTEEQRTRVAQRVKARIRGVEDLRVEVDELGVVTSIGTIEGQTREVPWPDFGPAPLETLLVEAIALLWQSCGAEMLPELVLGSDLAVVLDGHQLRIAETQTGVTAKPRERVDPAEAYTAEEAEEDIRRLAQALMEDYGHGVESEREVPEEYDPKPSASEQADSGPWRQKASKILSRLHGWRRGAPPSSAGHHHARAVFEGETDRLDRDTHYATPADVPPNLDPNGFRVSVGGVGGGGGAAGSATMTYARDLADLSPPDPLRPGDVLVVNAAGQAVRQDYTVEDAEADIALVAEPLAAYAQDTGTDASKAAAESRRDAARMLLKLSPWRAAVPAESAGLVHVRTVAGGS